MVLSLILTVIDLVYGICWWAMWGADSVPVITVVAFLSFPLLGWAASIVAHNLTQMKKTDYIIPVVCNCCNPRGGLIATAVLALVRTTVD